MPFTKWRLARGKIGRFVKGVGVQEVIGKLENEVGKKNKGDGGAEEGGAEEAAGGGDKKEAAGKLAALIKTVETWSRDEPVKTPGKNFLKSFVKAFKGAKDDDVDRMVQKLKDRSGWEEASKLAYAKPLLDTLGLS